jgi:5-methylcytosine-specific restriction endonuclease McrA
MTQGPHHRLYCTAAWRKRRAQQLAREPLCRKCHERGLITPATVADHVEPHRGDRVKFYRGELASLCAPCHSSDKQREEIGAKPKGCDVNGIPYFCQTGAGP